MPIPQIEITVREKQAGGEPTEPSLTLVRPRRSFETATIDSEGRASLALLPGESVLLVQADEVWEIRLSFRNVAGSTRSRRFFEE